MGLQQKTIPTAYVPGSPNIVDTFLDDGRSFAMRLTFNELRQLHPGAVLITLDEAEQEIGRLEGERYLSEVPEEFDLLDFHDRGNMVPPLLWQDYCDDTEVFVSSESVSGSFATFYVRVGDRCFQLTHYRDDIKGAIARVKQTIGGKQ